jgi:hypothetical protein
MFLIPDQPALRRSNLTNWATSSSVVAKEVTSRITGRASPGMSIQR